MPKIMGEKTWEYIMLDDSSWGIENQKSEPGASDARRQKKSRAIKGIEKAFDELLLVVKKSQVSNMDIATILTPDKVGSLVEALLTREKYPIETRLKRRLKTRENPINPMLYCTELSRAMRRGLEKNWLAISWDVPIICRPKEGTRVRFERKGRKVFGYYLEGEEKEVGVEPSKGNASFDSPFGSEILFETGENEIDDDE